MNMIPFMLMDVILTGNKIIDSTIGQGFMNMINDGIGAVQLIGGLVVLLIFVKVSAQKANEEEQERKKYTKWQIALGGIAVLIILAEDIFDLVLSYFGG